jgi:general secretion pathway protein F
MAAFRYKALTKDGKNKTGVCEADSAQQARAKLREQSLSPIEVTEVKAKVKGAFKRGTKLKAVELSMLTRQLATLISAGIPLDEALSGVADQQKKPALRAIVLGVRSKVMEGHSLAVGLADFPKSFPHLYRVTVAAGEKSGKLSMILERLADYTEQQNKMRQQMQQAMIYPALMMLVSIGVIVFLLSDVVPKIVSVFTQNQQTLPAATIVMLAISGFITHYGDWLLLGIIVFVILFRLWLRVESNKARWHKVVMRLPLIGKTQLTVNAARFARTLGILVRAGVPLLDAMRAASDLITILPMRYAVNTAVDRVREGQSLHKSLDDTNYFSPLFVHLLASGEATGELENLLARVADQQDQEVENVLKTTMALFEPIMILFMGGVVLFIVMAVMLPIFDMDQMVG